MWDLGVVLKELSQMYFSQAMDRLIYGHTRGLTLQDLAQGIPIRAHYQRHPLPALITTLAAPLLPLL
jgi:hypothetical protein